MNSNLHFQQKDNRQQKHKKKRKKQRYHNILPYLCANINRNCNNQNRICSRSDYITVPRYLERQQPMMLMCVIRNLKYENTIYFVDKYVTQTVCKFHRWICLSCGEIFAGGLQNKIWVRNRDAPHIGPCPIQRSIRNVTPCPMCRL